MSQVEDLRLKILDRKQVVLDDLPGIGDGVKTTFICRHAPVMEGTLTVKVDGTELTEGIDFSADYDTGKIDLAIPPPAGDEIRADYSHAAFTDAELQSFLDSNGGNINLAAGAALSALVSSRTRMVSWSKGDTKIDYDKLRNDLMANAKKFTDRGMSETGGARATDIEWEEII
jgi:hypothetical protein